jgi:hypothetical protein
MKVNTYGDQVIRGDGNMRGNMLTNFVALIQRKPGLLAILVMACALLLYVPFISQHVSVDDVVDLIKVERGPSSDYFVPRHMLHVWAAYIFYSSWKWLGYAGGAFLPMAVISALSGATGIALLFHFLHKVSRDWVSSLLICLLAGFSYGYWYHSTTMRVSYNIIAVVPIMVCLLLLLRVWEMPHFGSKWHYIVLMALSLSLATIIYQASVLLSPALIAGLFLDKHLASRAERLKLVCLFLLILCVFTGLPYLLVGVYIKGVRTPADFVAWWSTYDTAIPMWSKWELSRIPSLIQTLVAYIVPLNEGLRLRELMRGTINPDRLVPQLSLAVTLVSFAAGLAYLVRYRRRLWSDQTALVVVCGLFLLCSLVFFAWFDPYEPQYWLVHFIPVWTLLALIVADARRHFRRLSVALTAWTIGFLIIVAFSTFSLSVYPRRFGPDELAEKALQAKTFMTPSDILISPRWDWTVLVPYFADREVVSVLNASARFKGDRTAIYDWLDRVIAETWADGGHVYLVDVYSYAPGTWQFITLNTGLTLEDFSKYKRRSACLNKDEVVWEIVPTTE